MPGDGQFRPVTDDRLNKRHNNKIQNTRTKYRIKKRTINNNVRLYIRAIPIDGLFV